jgi:hypothetical protein
MAEIGGRGGNFRFVTFWGDNRSQLRHSKYTFLLHESTVLLDGNGIKGKYALTAERELIIYIQDAYANAATGSAHLIKSDDKMVQDLIAAILEDQMDQLLLEAT